MRYRSTSLLIAGLLLAACKQSAPTAEAQPAASPAATVAAPTVAAVPARPAIDAGFAVDMSYATLRGKLIDAGWLPLRDPMCRENVGGEAPVCNDLPEVESCSGDGYCVMHFADATEGKRIRVTTYGPYERWNVPGEEAALAVKSWQVSTPAASVAMTCPSKDFDAFLKAFATDDSVEQAFTAPLVKVAELYEDEDGDHERMVYVDGRAYHGFILDRRGDAWSLEPGDSNAAPVPVDVRITAEPEGTRYVTLPGNVEGISYRFAQTGDCWQLVADPDVVP